MVKQFFQSKTSVGIMFIVLTSFAIYLNSLGNAFVYDDVAQVLNNRWITDIKYLPEIFSSNVWDLQKEGVTSNYYRPLMHVIYMFNYYIFGLRPWGFHLVSILFHAGVSVMVFIIVLKLLSEFSGAPEKGRGPAQPRGPHFVAFVAAMLFAAHPVHTEAVVWVSSLGELSFTFFLLLSFYCYLLSGPHRDRRYILSLGFFFLGLFCKETAIMLPVIIVAYDYASGRFSRRGPGLAKRYVPYLIIAMAYLLMRTYALGGFAPQKQNSELGFYLNIINIFPLFSQYLGKLLLPVNLSVFHVFHPETSIITAKEMVGVLVTIAFIALVFIASKKDRLVFFGLLVLVIPLLPALYIPVLGENTFAERYLYLPSFGFVLLLAVALARSGIYMSEKAGFSVLPSAVLVGIYAFGTISMNSVWKDNYTLWTNAVKRSPDSATVRINLGGALGQKGLKDEAIEQYIIALNLKPDDNNARYNLGAVFFNKGWLDKAIGQYEAILASDPGYKDARNNLGEVFFAKGWVDKAIEQYQSVLRSDPGHARARSNLGLAFFSMGWTDEAIEQYRIVLKTRPNFAEAHTNLGLALAEKGLIYEAIKEYRTALELDPYYANAHNNLGILYWKKMGQLAPAVEEFQAAVRLNPDNVNFKNNLANASGIKNWLDRNRGDAGRQGASQAR